MASLVLVGAASGLPSPAFIPGRKLTTIDLVGGIYCHICTSVFGNKKEFDSHYLSHNTGTEQITYTCVACRASSTSYPSFRGHCYTTHVIKDKYKCDNCNKTFSKLSTLKEHIDAVHNFRCKEPNCQKRFPSRKELHVHQILHKEDPKPPYQCQNCTEEIENIDSCEDHIDRHCIFTYPCPICNETISKEGASQHLTKHFGFEVLNGDIDVIDNEEIPDDSSINIVGGVFCCYCKKLFKNRIEIDQHFGEDHPNEAILYSCIICGKQYQRYPQFGNHCYFHYSKNRFACETCHKTFPRLSLLVSHADEHESGGGCASPAKAGAGPRCQQCGLRLSSVLAARRHLAVHRRCQFGCPVCARRYGEKYLLMKHVPQHFEAVLHMCKVCHKVFGAKNRLIEHAKTHAPGAKSYECKFCGKGFLKPYQLSQHLNVHTGARPYSCSQCPKTFASRPNWHKHMHRMHNIDKRIKADTTNASRIELEVENESTSEFCEAEEAKVSEPMRSYDLDAIMFEPVTIDSRVVEIEAARYETEVKSMSCGGDPSVELAPILPEDIDKIVTELLSSPPPPPREYGPDWPAERPLAHAAPQLVGPPPPWSPEPPPWGPEPQPWGPEPPPWGPPLISKLCSGLYDQLVTTSDVSLSYIDTDIF